MRLDHLRVFESVIVVAFQSAFHSEKYANNIFLFFKNHFWDQHIKMIWKHKKYITSKQKKKFKFFEKCFPTTMPNALSSNQTPRKLQPAADRKAKTKNIKVQAQALTTRFYVFRLETLGSRICRPEQLEL